MKLHPLKLLISCQSSDISHEEQSYHHDQDMTRNADFYVHVVQKLCLRKWETVFPGWAGLNTQVHKEMRHTSNIGYLPVIDAPVTDMATVNEILQHSVSICQFLQLPEIVIVFNEAIFGKMKTARNIFKLDSVIFTQ